MVRSPSLHEYVPRKPAAGGKIVIRWVRWAATTLSLATRSRFVVRCLTVLSVTEISFSVTISSVSGGRFAPTVTMPLGFLVVLSEPGEQVALDEFQGLVVIATMDNTLITP